MSEINDDQQTTDLSRNDQSIVGDRTDNPANCHHDGIDYTAHNLSLERGAGETAKKIRQGEVTNPDRQIRSSDKLTPLFSSDRMDWATPQDFFVRVNAEFLFDLDAAALAHNTKCPKFLSPEDDALSVSWTGKGIKSVWLNPPYGKGIGNWIKKAWEESQKGLTVVVLIFARTDTKWWHEWAMKSSEIRLIEGRINFLDPLSGKTGKGGSPAPSALLIFKISKENQKPKFTTWRKKKIMEGNNTTNLRQIASGMVVLSQRTLITGKNGSGKSKLLSQIPLSDVGPWKNLPPSFQRGEEIQESIKEYLDKIISVELINDHLSLDHKDTFGEIAGPSGPGDGNWGNWCDTLISNLMTAEEVQKKTFPLKQLAHELHEEWKKLKGTKPHEFHYWNAVGFLSGLSYKSCPICSSWDLNQVVKIHRKSIINAQRCTVAINTEDKIQQIQGELRKLKESWTTYDWIEDKESFRADLQDAISRVRESAVRAFENEVNDYLPEGSKINLRGSIGNLEILCEGQKNFSSWQEKAFQIALWIVLLQNESNVLILMDDFLMDSEHSRLCMKVWSTANCQLVLAALHKPKGRSPVGWTTVTL
tara:strand:+ start:2713 stop:4482 length:1770 start_codon:yes stop_codon:yes gene_type:complete